MSVGLRRTTPRAVTAAATVLAVAIGGVLTAPVASGDEPIDGPGSYTNPVTLDFADDFPDPGVIRAKDGYWYAFSTQSVLTKENRDAGGPGLDLPIARSADLVSWELVGAVFDEDNHPDWRPSEESNFWAPDVRYVDGTYHLYYSMEGGGDAAVGLATAPTPAGPWTDSGGPVVNLAVDADVMEIDPALFVDDDGTKYLYYGSFRDGGMQVVELDAAGTRAVGEPTQVVTAWRGEAPWVVQREGYYYLFFSGFGCCAGTDGGYPVMVARASSPTGPFLDAEGVSLSDDYPGGTIVNSPNGNSLVSTGHNALVTDRSGQDWMLTNSVDRLAEDSWGRPVAMDRLDWIDGWPTVRAGAWSSDTVQTAPVTEADIGSAFSAEDSLTGWSPLRGGSWRWATDEQSGGHLQARSRGRESIRLVSTEAGPPYYRAEADLRVRSDTGAAGLVVAQTSRDDHVTAWLDPRRQALVVEVTQDGRSRSTEHPLPDGADLTAWHSVAAEVRGDSAHFEVTSAMEGSPLASASVTLPTSLTGGSAVGVASRSGAAEADNVGLTRLHQPVTERTPDPEVGSPLPRYGDEFDGSGLDPAWSWAGEPDPRAQVADGQFVWPTQDADLSNDEDAAAVLLRDAPSGTYTVETKLHMPFQPGDTGNDQAGIIAWNSREDSIHVGPTKVGTSRQAFLWIGRDANPWPETQLGPSANTLWLRMRHTVSDETGEHLFRAATSRDGENWIWGGTWHLPSDAEPRIGLVSHGGPNQTPAGFEYLRFYGP